MIDNPVESQSKVEEPAVQQQVQEDQVSYAKYRELLNEKKKVQQANEELAKKVQAIEEAKLIEEKRYKELYEARENELTSIRNTMEADKAKALEAKKVEAFLKSVGGLKNDSYLALLDKSKIIIESDGTVNKESLEDCVDSFKKSYPELLNVQVKKGLPEKAPVIETRVSIASLKADDILKQLKKGK